MKKAQGLSINTIIITILALLVLVVIAAIFTGRISIFGVGAATCQGRCVTQCDELTEKKALGSYRRDSLGEHCQDRVCCISIIGTPEEQRRIESGGVSEPPPGTT